MYPYITRLERFGTDSKSKHGCQEIGLLEVIWKVVEAVIDTWIKTVLQFHNVLHWYCAGIGIGTAIMDLKLAQVL